MTQNPASRGPQKVDAQKLESWEQTGEAKRQSVRNLFGQLAPNYDRINGIMSLSLHHRWRREATQALHLKPGNKVLDLCCGTGDFFAPLRDAVGVDGIVIGIDFSPPMLAEAKRKGVGGELIIGDASHLPFANAEFDAVSVGWGIRNVPDADTTHQESFRVLKPGGRFVSIDTAMPKSAFMRQLSKFVLGTIPALGRAFGCGAEYTYLRKSTERFKSREQLAESLRLAGFVEVGWKDMMFGNLCMHWGKRPLQKEVTK